MHQRGGVLVGSDDVQNLLAKLDAAYMLDSDRFNEARDQIVAEFSSIKVRPCSLCGHSYPADPSELKTGLDDILASQPPAPEPEGKIKALVAPHIDPTAGYKVYASAYGMMAYTKPSRVVVLGTGHHVTNNLFCLTEKDFRTPINSGKNPFGSRIVSMSVVSPC
jgi:hypothetical protein